MGNKVGKACGSISGRKAPHVPEPVVEPAAEPYARRSESLEWLNDLVGRLWPKIDEAVQKIIHEQVTPQLQQSLPGPFKGTHFKKCTLGTKTPQLGPIEVVERKDGLKLILDVDYQSDVDMQISAVVASIGIKSISLRGQLMIRLGPLIGEMPVVGGITAYFNDQPDLNLEFTGIGAVAELPMIYNLIHKQINSAISNAVVLPNCISVPLATPQQGVDPALLKKPQPLALLRVAAVKAEDLAARDWNVLGKSSSDPFVRVRVANDTWNSSVVKQNLNPTWTPEDCHDFLVFDMDQEVWVEVFDEDHMTGADLIGRATPVKAAAAQSGKDLELFDEKGQPSGHLQMTFEWLSLVEIDPKVQSPGCVLMVEMKRILAPNGEAALLSAKIASQEKRTALTSPKEAELEAEDKLRLDVARRCKAEGLDEAQIAKIAGLGPDVLKAALESADGKGEDPKPLEFQQVFYFSVPQKGLESEELIITVHDSKETALAKSSLKMSELLEKGSWSINQMHWEKGGAELSSEIEVKLYGLKA